MKNVKSYILDAFIVVLRCMLLLTFGFAINMLLTNKSLGVIPNGMIITWCALWLLSGAVLYRNDLEMIGKMKLLNAKRIGPEIMRFIVHMSFFVVLGFLIGDASSQYPLVPTYLQEPALFMLFALYAILLPVLCPVYTVSIH